MFNLFPISSFILSSLVLDSKTMPAKVSFNIELGPELSNEVMDVARKQGEDPERLSADIQELRDMIYGKLPDTYIYVSIEISSFSLKYK